MPTSSPVILQIRGLTIGVLVESSDEVALQAACRRLEVGSSAIRTVVEGIVAGPPQESAQYAQNRRRQREERGLVDDRRGVWARVMLGHY